MCGHRFTRRITGITALCIASVTFADSTANEFHGLNAGAPIWNGNLVLSQQQAAKFAATGTNALRVNFRLDFGHSSWDAYQLAMYDQVVANATNAGLTVLGLFSNETVACGQTTWNDDADGDGRNSYVDAFADTAQFLADRYKDNIKQWEVWNEPNAWTNPSYASNPQQAGGSYILPRVYANVLSETYRHFEAPGFSLISGQGVSLASGGLFAHDIGGSLSTAMDYMQQVYDRTGVWNAMQTDFGRRYAWDDFGYHFYISQGTPVSNSYLASYFNSVRATQAANNDNADVVVTEFGWQTVGSNTQQFQRDNMAKAYDFLETRNYVSGTYWYQWTDDGTGAWGIVDGNQSPKLSYHEFAARNQSGRIVATTEHASSDAGLSHGYATDDLLQGRIATEREGDLGWHPANPAAGDSLNVNGLPAFTDGLGDLGSGLTGLLNDFPASGLPAKLLEYDLGGRFDLDAIRIFTGNFGQDGRIFSTTAIHTSTDGVIFDLLGYFQSDESGTTNNGSTPGGPDGATLVSIARDDGSVLASGVTHLRFDFFAVSDLNGVYRDPFDGVNLFSGTNDGLARAFVSPLLREIDVLGSLTEMLGDVNHDGLVDIFDVNVVSDHWGDSGAPGIPGDANRDGVVDIFDVNLISDHWSPAGAQAAVAEPNACILLALALAAASATRAPRDSNT